MFGRDACARAVSQLETKAKRLVLTEPMFAPDELRATMCEVMFEEYEFGSLFCAPPAMFAAMARCNNNDAAATAAASSRANGADGDLFRKHNCGIVVDVGYSGTHIVPIFGGRVLNYAVRRIDVGGKALTNYMKEVSARSSSRKQTALTYFVMHAVDFVSTL